MHVLSFLLLHSSSSSEEEREREFLKVSLRSFESVSEAGSKGSEGLREEKLVSRRERWESGERKKENVHITRSPVCSWTHPDSFRELEGEESVSLVEEEGEEGKRVSMRRSCNSLLPQNKRRRSREEQFLSPEADCVFASWTSYIHRQTDRQTHASQRCAYSLSSLSLCYLRLLRLLLHTYTHTHKSSSSSSFLSVCWGQTWAWLQHLQ